MTSLRLALAAALLSALTACTAVVPLDVTQELPVQSSAPAGDFALEKVIDLATAGAVWDRRDRIDAVSVDEVTATVVSVGPANAATTASFTVALRPDGAPADGSRDLPLGTFAALAIRPGATATLPGSAALDAFILAAVQGTGRFTVIASGSLDGAADAVLAFNFKGSAAYRVIGK